MWPKPRPRKKPRSKRITNGVPGPPAANKSTFWRNHPGPSRYQLEQADKIRRVRAR